MNNPKKRLRVLHLIETLGSGGAERLLFTNLKHLDSDVIESEVVTVFDRDQYWREPVERLGIAVTSLGCSGHRDVPGGVGRLKKLIGASRPHLIHTHLFMANIVGRIAGRISGVPVISSVHNPEYEPEVAAGLPSSTRQKIRLAHWLDRATSRFGCVRMIAVSQYVKKTTVSRLRYPAAKIDVLYNPIDMPQIVGWKDRNAMRQTLGLDEGSVLLLHVGRLTPQKGFIDAVAAMPAILSHVPSAQLMSVGAQADPAYKATVLKAIGSLGVAEAVHLAGEQCDVPNLLNACDVFVFPSRYEGLGIALAEAMAAGCACVTSDMEPLTEFVQHDRNGVLVPAGEPERLASAIIDLVCDPPKRERLGDAARSTALEMFDPSRAAKKLTEIYFSVRP